MGLLEKVNFSQFIFSMCSFFGKNTLHLQPYRLFGFCLDCFTETQNSLDRSKLRPSQSPTNNPSQFIMLMNDIWPYFIAIPMIQIGKSLWQACMVHDENLRHQVRYMVLNTWHNLTPWYGRLSNLVRCKSDGLHGQTLNSHLDLTLLKV